MGNKIAVYFSGVRFIDIGDLKLDDITSENSDLTKFLDMKYYHEITQIDLIIDTDDSSKFDVSDTIPAEEVYKELGITGEDLKNFENIEFDQ